MQMSPDASEVVMYAENDRGLYDALMNIYLPNLQKKVKKGVYDRTLALKLMEYYYQNYIRPWMKSPRNAGYDPNLDKKDRAAVAEYFLNYLETETDLLKSKKVEGRLREGLGVDKSDPKNIDTGISNIFLKGGGWDINGNMRIIVGFPNDRGIPIQTGGGDLSQTDSLLRKAGGGKNPKLNRLSDDEIETIGREVTKYIQKYVPKMAKRLSVYDKSLKGGDDVTMENRLRETKSVKFDKKKYSELYQIGKDKGDNYTLDDYENLVRTKFGGWVDPYTLHVMDVAKDENDFIRIMQGFYKGQMINVPNLRDTYGKRDVEKRKKNVYESKRLVKEADDTYEEIDYWFAAIERHVMHVRNLIRQRKMTDSTLSEQIDIIKKAMVEIEGMKPVTESRLLREYDEEDALYYMLNHYIVTALWSSTDDDDANLDDNYSRDDIDQATLTRMESDCKKFIETVNKAGLMDAYLAAYGNDERNAFEMMGHDFWLTQNGHGAGFWDRTELDEDGLGDKLTKIADAFRERYLYVGDDGKVHMQ